MDTRQATYLKLLGIQAWCKQEDLPRIREYQRAQAGRSVNVQSSITEQNTLVPSQANHSLHHHGVHSAEMVTTQRKQGFFSAQLSSIIDGEHIERESPKRENRKNTHPQRDNPQRDNGKREETSPWQVDQIVGRDHVANVMLESNAQYTPKREQMGQAFNTESLAESLATESSIAESSTSKSFAAKPFNNAATSIFTNEFLQSIRQCCACAFSQSRQQVTLPRQQQNAKVMVITDIPLKEEMYQGKVLDRQDESFFFKALSAVGLPEESLYMTPFIKCRPPELRDVTTQEWQACAPILQKEINELNPDLLFILGRNSVKFLLGQALPFDQLRGVVHQVNIAGHHFPAIISHSPRVYAHNARLKSNFWRDVKLLRRTLDSV